MLSPVDNLKKKILILSFKKNLARPELEKLADLKKGEINSWKRFPSTRLIQKIADVFEVDLKDLI